VETLDRACERLQKNKKILKKYICSNQGGGDHSPKISWKSIGNAKSYALILEDPDAVIGNFVHWYIPFIQKDINQINSLDYHIMQNINPENLKIDPKTINIIHGKNTLNKIGYHGPCAPEGSGTHRYIFNLYALDGILIKLHSLQISGTHEFENILRKNKITIISKEKKEFLYGFRDYAE